MSAMNRTGPPGAQRLRGLGQAVADQLRRLRRAVLGDVHEQLVVEAEHDPRAERRRPGPDGDGPHLEQLGRGPLDHRVAPVPAAAGTGAGGLGVGRARAAGHPDQPAAVGAQVLPGLRGAVGGVEVAHGDRVGGPHPPPGVAAVPGRLPVHRGDHRDLGGRPVDAELGGHREVHVVGRGGGGERGVAGDGGEHPGLDLPEVGPDEQVPRLGDDRPAEHGGHVVQPARRGHPPGRPVAAGPGPAQPVVGPEGLVQPGVPVGGGYPLRLAPLEQRRHQRRLVLELLQPPGPGVRHVDPGRGEQRSHLDGAAQVGDHPGRRVPEHPLVPGRPDLGRVGRAARPGSDDVRQQALDRRPVHRQPVRRQLRRQQLDGRLGARGGDLDPPVVARRRARPAGVRPPRAPRPGRAPAPAARSAKLNRSGSPEAGDGI